MGAVLIALTVGVLIVDQWLAPWYPFLFVLVMTLAGLACFELRGLLDTAIRPPIWLCFASVLGLVAVNWIRPIGEWLDRSPDPWLWTAGLLAAVLIAAFLWEMSVFRNPGGSVTRIAAALWMAGYLGLLPCFLIQLRWQSAASSGKDMGVVALTLAVFVPKCSDTGAYFTGRFFGKHRLAPTLSPKKTWEGAVGGLVAGVIAAIGINRCGPILSGIGAELGFGITVSLAAMLGDLAESLIKRDCGRKDASQVVPGFGGVLDILDSILFAAPVAYCWLTR
jgi:phosphatidate cytidylyltransferase